MHNKSKMQKSPIENFNEDGLFDLLNLIRVLNAKKILIAILTIIFTIIASINIYGLKDNYSATSLFIKPSTSSLNYLEDTFSNKTLTSKDKVYTKFLNNLTSKELQIKAFNSGNFLSKFNLVINPDDDSNYVIQKTLGSIELSQNHVLGKELLNDRPYEISMSGINKHAIEEYINYLVSYVNFLTIAEISKSSLQIMLNELSKKVSYIELLRSQEIEDRGNEIIKLTELMDTAKGLGIIESNFNTSTEASGVTNNFTLIGENQSFPSWFIYGEKALAQQIKVLESRSFGDPFIDGLSTLNLQVKQLENNITKLNSLAIDDHLNYTSSMTVIEVAYSEKTSTSKKSLLFIYVLTGFFLSIFLVLMLNYKAAFRKLHN